MSYDNSVPDLCSESPPGKTPSSFQSATPICAYNTNDDGDLVVSITNLLQSTSYQPDYYGVRFDGITTGNAAIESLVDG
jgi:hypothetical protein